MISKLYIIEINDGIKKRIDSDAELKINRLKV